LLPRALVLRPSPTANSLVEIRGAVVAANPPRALSGTLQGIIGARREGVGPPAAQLWWGV